MAGYRYVPGRPSESIDLFDHEELEYGDAVPPGTNAYIEDSFVHGNHSDKSSAMLNPKSQFYGLDPQLAGFVQKHNVVLDDGAVLNVNAMQEKTALEKRARKHLRPPVGLSFYQFIAVTVALILLVTVVIIAVTVGLIFGLRLDRPKFPRAKPWWRRTQMYQLNVATWANDVGGPTGRLADVIPRMTYLSEQLGVTSVIFTGLLASDAGGVTDWTDVSTQVAAPDEAFSSLLPSLVFSAKQPMGPSKKNAPIQTLIGLPLYATSERHQWFQQSRLAQMSRYSNFYLWQGQPPTSAQENRYLAYDATRRAYYRHVHGTPQSPLLNLTDSDVQSEMRSVLRFWRKNLNIQGVVIINSSNVLPEMMPAVRTILNSQDEADFIWFADDPLADSHMNPGNKVCLFSININRRVPTRTDDLNAQLIQAINDTRLITCSPIWRVAQLCQEDKDYLSIQQLALFLPGSYLMMAGQESDLSTGSTQLIGWAYRKFNDYSTYWPVNINLPNRGENRVLQWRAYWTRAMDASILDTAITNNRLSVIQPRLNDNVLALCRMHTESWARLYFVVSFQTLNTVFQLSRIFIGLNDPVMEVIYDSKNAYHGRRQFDATTLVNNEVLLLYYY